MRSSSAVVSVSPPGAIVLADGASLSARFLLLAKYPLVGRQRDELAADLRAFPVGEYVVLYRPVGEDVLVLRVVRGSRDLEALFRE